MWVDFIAQHAKTRPNKVAVVLPEQGRRVTYAELEEEISRWALRLYQMGLLKGDVVAFLACNRLEHLAVFFACAKLRLPFVPLNFRLSHAELQKQLDQLDNFVLIGEGRPSLRGAVEYVDLKNPGLPPAGSSLPARNGSDEDILLVLFTSGTTGEPKGVCLSARMLAMNAVNTEYGWGLTGDDVTLVQTPFFHTGGWNVLTLPVLRLGGRVVLDDAGFDVTRTWRILEQESVSYYFGVPTMFDLLSEDLERCGRAFASVRFCISGGAPCPKRVLDRFRAMGLLLRQGYGLTECGPNCFHIDEETAAAKPDAVGRPMFYSKVRLVKMDGSEAGVNEVGEFQVNGPHLCSGYWKKRALFDAACEDGFFSTGDLMRRDEDGVYYVVGRVKDMYISGGENVFPGEVERQLLLMEGVIDVAVVAVEDEKWGEVGFAFVKTERSLSLAEVRDFLNDRLSRYKHPHYLCRLEAFPLLANGKVDRKGLAAHARTEVCRV